MRPLWRIRARSRALVAVAAVVALVGVPAPARSAPSAGPADTAAVCGTPAKGHVACFAVRRLDVGGQKGLQSAVTPAGYGPDDLRSAYRLPADGGAGQTVAIVDAYDDPNAEADLAVYREQFGLPACTSDDGCFRKINQRGGTVYPNRDYVWAEEISLDLDMVSAAAPLAHLLLVEADSTSVDDMTAAVDQAVAQGAKFVSNSYGTGFTGSPEDPSETTDLDAHYNHPGVAMVAASGDQGFGVVYPAASPYVTSVGGTALVRDDSARGFSETVWHSTFNGPGSGCSAYEPKPLFQKDTGCDMRTVADVAAVADPATGVAVYNSYGIAGLGWVVYGGTSAAAPIITGAYAAAGTPVPGSYPNAYPYTHRAALNDVTSGNNGTCTPEYLCTAGPGYDGPTGLGTPAGPGAFSMGPHGTVSGTVTDSVTRAPVGGATVRAGDGSTTTDAQGRYTLVVPAGTLDVAADAYGYSGTNAPGVTVADGATVTSDLALVALPRSIVSGTVTDGSGHGWPLYAKITVDGVPGGPVFTDPYTGHYSLTLPQGRTYTAHLTANYPGYQPVDLSLPLGTDDVHRDVAVPIDLAGCTAPGWATHYAGTHETFDTTGTPPGWTVGNANNTGGWVFDDPNVRGNRTGGDGHFAIVDSLNSEKQWDTVLTSPVSDLSAVAAPALSFDTQYLPYFGPSTGDVDISADGGTTWTNVWHHTNDAVDGHVELPLPQAAHAAQVVARFHYTATSATWWELDNVLIGSRSCDKVPGGLVVGRVTDANTGAGVNGATVTGADTATSAATPGDPNVGDGFYRLFSSATGSRSFTVTRRAYATVTRTLDVAADSITRGDVALPAGRVAISPATISKTVAWNTPTTAKLTLTNTGTAPATVSLAEQPGSFQMLAQGGAAPQVVKTNVTPLAMSATASAAAKQPADVNPAAAPWTAIANYPVLIQDNLVDVFGGKVYSAFGWTGAADLADLYAYDPDTADWTKLARAGDIREAPAGGFIANRLYATGGWGADGQPDPKTEAYDPDTNTWTTVADNPQPAAGSGSAILNDRLFVIGGCTKTRCDRSDVHVYDPAGDSWTAAADYPEPVAWPSCGALAGKLYCAGGTTIDASVAHTYVYDPGTNAWTPRASMPTALWGSAHAGANGRLLVSGGVNPDSAITNRGFAYDPVTDAWSTLPNSNDALYRGGSACGLYRIGGSPSGLGAPPVGRSEVLPGFTDCGPAADVPWLSESTDQVTIKPGAHTTVTLTLDPGVASITQPGTYAASLLPATGTPYPAPRVDVTMVVRPPASWGRIAGTVTGPDGTPLGAATVQIETWASSYTLKTDRTGRYGLWLDVRNNPLKLIVAKDGYQPQAKSVKITKGKTTTLDFTLKTTP